MTTDPMTLEKRLQDFHPDIRLALFDVMVPLFQNGAKTITFAEILTLYKIKPFRGDFNLIIDFESKEFNKLFIRWANNEDQDVCRPLPDDFGISEDELASGVDEEEKEYIYEISVTGYDENGEEIEATLEYDPSDAEVDQELSEELDKWEELSDEAKELQEAMYDSAQAKYKH